MFETYDAAKYRALDHDAFVARKKEVLDLMNAAELPEGVTDEMLYAEADLIEADAERRSKANKLFASKIEAVAQGAGTVIASTEPDEKRSMPKAEVHEFKARNREASQKFTDTVEYREALAKHILRQAPMPREMIAKAVQERSNDNVTLNAGYSNMTDPTFSHTLSSLVVVPSTLSDEVQKELRETSVLFPKINVTNYQGQLAVSEYDLQVTGHWIGDKETSPYQYDYDPEVFTWGWYQFEARFARSFLAQALMSPTYVSQLAPALAECYANEMDKVVLEGTGSAQPRGITKDLRLVGSDGKGLDSNLTAWYTQRAGSGKGRALVIEVTEEEINDWRWWKKLGKQPKFNRLYRNKGELVIADGTWYDHVEMLRDDNNRPISVSRPLQETEQLNIVGLGPVSLMPNFLLKPFEIASDGDVIGFYGNLKNYTMNVQPGMPLTTTSWDDHDTNLHKTKILTAMDGRVSNPFGWIILKKKASA